MRLAVSGNHPDALAVAAALVQTGRHELIRYWGPPDGLEWFQKQGILTVAVADRDALFADAAIQVWILGDALAERAEVLRRAIRCEKHIVCVHPVDLLPDITYEAALIQEESRKVLLPLLWPRLHPALAELRRLLGSGSPGAITLLEGELVVRPRPAVPLPPRPGEGRRRPPPDPGWDGHPLLWCWDLVRFLGGEVSEVSAVGAGGDQIQPQEPLTVSGRCHNGWMYRLLLIPGSGIYHRFTLRGPDCEAVLMIPDDWADESSLTWQFRGEESKSTWNWQPWDALAAEIEKAIGGSPMTLSWLDETRCLELFDAVRQSARRRRVIPMAYEEVSEGANFKTVMATLGCLVLLGAVLLLIVFLAVGAPLVPVAKYVLLPLLVLFLVLQLLGWMIPRRPPPATQRNRGAEKAEAR